MRSGFFNSFLGDRKYSAANWAEYFSRFIGNGVYANPATSMQVQAAGGLTVRIAAGSCFINGYTGYSDGSDVLKLQYGGTYPRIDRVVIRLDMTTRSVTIYDAGGAPYVMKGKDSAVFTVKIRDDMSEKPVIQKYILPSECGENGELRIHFDPRDTVSLETGYYLYDVAVCIGGKDFYTAVIADTFQILPALGEPEVM